MQRLFDLPIHLLAEILTNWVNIHSLVVLDSATCSRECRVAYLELLRSNEFCVGEVAFQGFQVKEMEWFVSRRVKRKEVVISEDFNGGDQILTLFLQRIGSHIERLRFSGRKITILEKTDLYFPRLRVLIIETGAKVNGQSLHALLSRYSRTLKRLKLDGCYMLDPFSSDSHLPDLEMLSISGSFIDTAFLCRLISFSPSLRSFYCDHWRGDDCLEALTAHCPLLQVLAYDIGRSEAAREVTAACPALEVVDFMCIGRDEHIFSTLHHCEGLKAIHAHGEFLETSLQCMDALQARLPSLRHLSLFECRFDTDAPLLALAPLCGNLRSLELEGLWDVISQESLVTLVRNLKNIVELDWHDTELDDKVLEAIAAHCPALEVLHLCEAEGCTEDGILAVAKGCAALKRLYLSFEDEDVASSAAEFWQELRPGLQVKYGTEVSEFWTSLQDIERAEVAGW